jgi:fructoselysine 6-phosphate deglycase
MTTIQEQSLFYTSGVIPEAMHFLFDHHESALKQLAREFTTRGIQHLYCVGGGASLSAMMGIEYTLQRFTSLPVQAFNGRELLAREPQFDAHTAVIATSYLGQTPEVLEVVQRARQAGALVIAITDHQKTPLAKASEVVIDFHSKAVYISPLTIGYLLAAYLMQKRAESGEMAARLLRDVHSFPAAVEDIVRKALEEPLDLSLAEHYYVVAEGPQYGLGYKLALSVIIENLWTNASIINTGEFYHGPIEIIHQGQPSFVSLLGEDPSRPAQERVSQFCREKGVPLLNFDVRTYGTYSDLMAVYPLFIATEVWVMRVAARLGHDVDERRYMGKVATTWGEF